MIVYNRRIFKIHFDNIREKLYIKRPFKFDIDNYSVVNAMKNFSQHPSTLKFKQITRQCNYFSFQVSKEDIMHQINFLDPSKATQKFDIRTKIVNDNSDNFQITFLQITYSN